MGLVILRMPRGLDISIPDEGFTNNGFVSSQQNLDIETDVSSNPTGPQKSGKSRSRTYTGSESMIDYFTTKRPKGTIDIYWLYDDGGLTMLLPYIISTRSNWSNCKLRIFALARKGEDIKKEEEE
jgi:hypothetical protein